MPLNVRGVIGTVGAYLLQFQRLNILFLDNIQPLNNMARKMLIDKICQCVFISVFENKQEVLRGD